MSSPRGNIPRPAVFGAVLSALILAAGFPDARAEENRPTFIRGVTVSCQTWGIEWARPEMATTMDDLKSMGAGWIAIHPYARISADGGVRFPADVQPAYIVKPLAWARERGMGVMLVPHIAYWGSPFSWRGEIDFADVEKWGRFFADYERWIVGMARLAEEGGAGLLCIGLEYTHSHKYEQRWRNIIAEVRKVYKGKVTYGANWNEFESIKFWDALDYIGVLAYFPLSTAKEPSDKQISAGWDPWLKKLGALSASTGKPVLFTEVGYDANPVSAARPWEPSEQPKPEAAGLQARCLEQALALETRGLPWLAGMFLWKWFPDIPDPEHETFDLRKPGVREVLKKRWAPGE